MSHDTRFTDMAKPSIGKDFLKITYKIKPKGMSAKSEKEEPEDEMEDEGGGELSAKLREAADLVDEGMHEEALSLIEEAADMCAEYSGSESEDESEMDMD